MLTAKEMANLKQLQEKAKNHQPITDEELEKMENRSLEDFINPERIRILFGAWNKIMEIVHILATDNVRLVAEVRYLKKKCLENR